MSTETVNNDDLQRWAKTGNGPPQSWWSATDDPFKPLPTGERKMFHVKQWLSRIPPIWRFYIALGAALGFLALVGGG